MLAGPKWYKFWTKIYLEWLWVWEISDRWWAIVHAWKRGYNYDRIDLWVGYWDEGLKRALYWGKRKIKWKIVSRYSKVTINNKKIPAPNWATNWLKKISNIFNTPLWVGSNKNQVKELQKFLQKIWLYKGKIDWIYNSEIINIIYNFQLKNWIIKNWQAYWAWYWGYKTRNKMLKKYLNWDFDIKTNQIKKTTNKNKSIFDKPLKTIEETKQLQEILKKLELYNWEINGSYSDIQDIILDFQLKNKIIKNKNELGAGYFWPKTRAKLKEIYDNLLEEEQRKKELEEKFKFLEKLALQEAEKKVNNLGKPKLWDITPQVRELQKSLKSLGYFNYKDTAIFWPITKKALIKYQIEKNLIKNENHFWAGIFWPKTKKQLTKDLAEIILKEKLEKEPKLVEFLEKKKDNKKEFVENENKQISKNTINKKDYLQVMLQIEKRLII
jgi:peptidoglycan hydrolase-like protein with peptidoglycan-binding domain